MNCFYLAISFFSGNYNFFDYKYDIPGYCGQDFGGFPQYFYLIFSFVLMTELLIGLRKMNREHVTKYLRIAGIFFVVFYLAKTTWETVHDLATPDGFNWFLLPLDTCSLVMPAALMAGFGNGRLKKFAEGWLVTGGIVGGFANMLFLNAFKYYPFLSFGAFYSMFWHFLMVFTGLLLVVTEYTETRPTVILHGFAFQTAASLIAIPVNFIFLFDFMLYRNLGGVPVFEDVAGNLTASGLQWLDPVLMTELYFGSFCLIWLLTFGIGAVVKKIRGRDAQGSKIKAQG